MNFSYNDFSQILNSFSKGEFIIVFDEDREVEGDFFVLAENITPKKINFLLEHGRGMICTACDGVLLDRLKLPLMVENNENPHGTNFCISVDAKEGVTTGVSAFDRAKTISVLANPLSTKSDLVIPGHSFPLRAEQDTEKRFGHTEAAVLLAQKTHKIPAVVICEIINKEGHKATIREVKVLAEKFNMPMTNLKILKKELTPRIQI
ncbi:3,4-dihydroxy-2-butanone-4-phosphate synthase [Candidatus Gracilibacteria bacterium]|nr:3,4-dihydroxy-2-butanone-4-phosphate synthase [Candidatus Gracilibacteria bacterium]